MAIGPSGCIALQTLQPTRHPLRPVPALVAARNPGRHNFGRAAAGLFAATSAFAHTASHRLRSKRRNGTSRWQACAAFATEAKEYTEAKEAQDFDLSDEFQRSSRLGIRRLKLWPGITDIQYDFGGLPIPKRLRNAFVERGIMKASSIQSTAMQKLSLGEHAIIHAPTGSGKTLSYLLPVLARLQPTMHIGAQALILVPTPELAIQVAREAKWLIDVLSGEQGVCWFNPQVPKKLACEVLLSGDILWDAIRSDTAVVVTTPGIILAELKNIRHAARRFSETLAYFMGSNMRSVILDEVDSLCPAESPSRRLDGVGAAQQVIEYVVDVLKVRYRNRPLQFIAASATGNGPKVVRVLDRILERKYPKRRDIARRTSPQLLQPEGDIVPARRFIPKDRRVDHASVPQKIRHATVTLERDDRGEIIKQERFALVARILSGLAGRGTVLLCVPDRVRMDDMIDILEEARIKNVFKYRALMGLSLPPDAENDKITPSDCFYQLADLDKRLSANEEHVLVAKMNACRGIDLQNIQYVVLFGLPVMAGDYLHLAGRTGRMGRSGTTITLVTNSEEDTVLPKLEDRLQIKFTKWDVETASLMTDDTSQAGEQEFKREGDNDSDESGEDMAARTETSTSQEDVVTGDEALPAEKPHAPDMQPEVEEKELEADEGVVAAQRDVMATEEQNSAGSRQEVGASRDEASASNGRAVDMPKERHNAGAASPGDGDI